MKKLILSCVILSTISGSVFALSCPGLNEVVSDSMWVVPEGWNLIQSINNPEKLSPYVETSAKSYGHLRCKYKGENALLEIENPNISNGHIIFSNYWSTEDGKQYHCTCPLEYVHICSYELDTQSP